MRKLLFLISIVLLFAVPSFALLHIGINGGYSYSSMTELNNYWEKIKADADSTTFTVTDADWKGYGNGIFGNIELNFTLDKENHMLLGIRSGLQYVFPAEYTGFREIDIPPTIWVTTKTTSDNFLIPLMAGLSFNFPFGDSALSITGEAYGGWGLAYSAQNTQYEGSVLSTLALYSGGGLMADVSGAIELKLLPVLTISLNGGYRFAKMSDFKAVKSISADIPGYGTYEIPLDSPFNDDSGTPVAIDFSGMNIGIGINIRL